MNKLSKVHVREDGKFLKIAVYPIPLTEETVKDLVRQIAKGQGYTLNNVTMLWHADGNHALELIFERPSPPAVPVPVVTPDVVPSKEKEKPKSPPTTRLTVAPETVEETPAPKTEKRRKPRAKKEKLRLEAAEDETQVQ